MSPSKWPWKTIGIGVIAGCSVMTIIAVWGGVALRRSPQALAVFKPDDLSEWVNIQPDGSFSAKFQEERLIDIPLADPKAKGQYVRVMIKKGMISGRTIVGQTLKKKFPVKLIVFSKPHMLVGDILDKNRDSLVPGIAKLLGALPNVVALVCYKRKEAWSIAPQLSGHGASENPGLIRDLMKLDDVIDPEILAKF